MYVEIQKSITETLSNAMERVGNRNFSLPSLHGARSYDPANEVDLAKLSELGVRVDGKVGAGNTVAVAGQVRGLTLRFNGRSNNCILIGKSSKINGPLGFESDGNFAVFGDNLALDGFNSTMRVAGSQLLIGSDCTSNGVNFGVQGPGNVIVVFDDCMFSWGVQIRTTDSHGIFDIDSLEQRNHASSVIIGPHVWLGFNSVVNKGTVVGGGAIIGAGAIVTSNIPQQCAVAGVPARVVRERVCWTRTPTPSSTDMSAILKRFF
ncbi:acyltransferase [Paraburkholderia tropica]|uniref:acyltransferase n=1 Tax=Paraburkholderia tropica TaxID=92647 RepID=UPI003D2CD061